jgi:EmrB/QacA subfamily drug resistance transporter
MQGLGAAVMMPNTLSILTNTFTDPKERAQAIGIWAGVSGISLALGPVLGGLMVDAWGWQSIFYINVPIGVIAFFIAFRVVMESKNPEGRSLDIPGQILAIVGLGTLTYAFIEANSYGWGSALIVTLFVVGVAALVAFGVWETRVKSPMLQLRFFRNMTFLGSNLVGLSVSFGFFGMVFFLGLFLQNVQGYTPVEAGVRMLASTLAVMVSAVVSGRIVGRIGARVPVTIGMTLMGLCILGFTQVQTHTPYSSYWWLLTILGIGTGLVMSPITTAAMSTVPSARAGMASATLNTLRQVGGVFGIAVLGSIVTGRLVSEIRAALNALDLPPFVTDKVVEIARQGGGVAGDSTPSIPGIDVDAIREVVRLSFTTGMHRALWFAGAVVLAGAVVGAIMIRGTAPHEQLARQAGAAASAAGVEPGGSGPPVAGAAVPAAGPGAPTAAPEHSE